MKRSQVHLFSLQSLEQLAGRGSTAALHLPQRASPPSPGAKDLDLTLAHDISADLARDQAVERLSLTSAGENGEDDQEHQERQAFDDQRQGE